MPAVNPDCYHLSASSIASFKACPTRFRLAYREGLRLDEDTDSQRVGTNWHAIHEVYQGALVSLGDDPNAHEQAVEAAIAHLNQRYAEGGIPASKTVEEWDVERQILATSFIGYLWYWQNDPVEPIVSEVAFDLPLHAPRTGLPLPVGEVLRVGKIDHIVKWQGMIGNVERKSTARSIDPSSDYWDKARKDTQVSMYALAFRDLLESGTLPDAVKNHPAFDPKRFGNTMYDVWHKPTIKPAGLSQKDTLTFIETGEYHDQTFEVEAEWDTTTEVKNAGKKSEKTVETKTLRRLVVDGDEVAFTVGKSGGAAIDRETPAMYAARLMSDIYSRPEFYYQRKEIARTDADIRKFRQELFNIYQAQRMFSNSGCWYENEQQCRATFPCSYIPICYGPGADAVCDGETTPPGFKRIFVDLTRETQPIEGD